MSSISSKDKIIKTITELFLFYSLHGKTNKDILKKDFLKGVLEDYVTTNKIMNKDLIIKKLKEITGDNITMEKK